MKQVQLRSLKKGSLFRLYHSVAARFWVRSDYNRSTKKYEIYLLDDFNISRFTIGSVMVYVEPDFV